MSDGRDQLAVGPFAEVGGHFQSLITVLPTDAHFKQFVVRQAGVQFRDYAVGNPTVANHHHRFEIVGEATKVAFLFRCQ